MWVKLSDDWIDSMHVEDLGAEAVVLHLSALSYCSRQSTDGLLPKRDIRKLWPADDVDTAIATLEEAGEWQSVATGWLLVNWKQHLMAKAEVEHRREQSRITTERHRRHKEGDHSMCDRCAFVKRGDASPDQSVTPLYSLRLDTPRSDSSRLEAELERRGEESGVSGSARATPTTPQGEQPKLTPHPSRGTDPYNCLCGLPVTHPVHEVPA